MDPRPVTVTDSAGDWQGWLLAWRRDGDHWRGLVRYRKPHETGYVLTYEHAVDGGSLRPR
ncbi:hypothetical protein [Longivirga aurantiaca]|uniref:Uncharacterized protein n=1 Tax=Longivirga aurantiaca TaxID=1837743 RepID=A0ABW1T2X7_9ACTN